MIVKSLHVEGFMRHERLDLDDLPRGVIAVLGDNESGKSTVGEAIAFALFGRAVRTEATDPTQAIHWDLDACRTAIEVEVAGRGVHRVERLVARTGELEARLLGPDGAPLASGVRPVAEAVRALLGLDFSTFRYSFYVAQHELDLIQRDGRDNARRIVHDMLGVTTVERARALVDREREERVERAGTLERDLVVTSALLTEALPVQDELAAHGQRLEAALARQAQAALEDGRTRLAHELAERAVAACRDRRQALGRFEAALVTSAQRATLGQGARRLVALARAAAERAQAAEAEAKALEAPRAAARAAIERADAAERAAQVLATHVAGRRDELAARLGIDDPDGVAARVAKEAAARAQAERAARREVGLGVAALALAALALGAAAATRVPAAAPALTFAARVLEAPSVGLRWEVSPASVTAPLGVAGLALALVGGLGLWARGRDARRAQAAGAEATRLCSVEAAVRAELAACEGFAPAGLAGTAAALRGIDAPKVKAALERLEAAAGPLMTEAAPAVELAARARKGLEEVEQRARAAESRLVEARRLEADARAALAEVTETLKGVAPDMAIALEGEAPGIPAAPGDPAGQREEVQKTLARAIRARVELDALAVTGRPGGRASDGVADAAEAVRGAVARALEAHAGDAAAARSSYEEQTGLGELLKPRGAVPPAPDLRAVIARERELLDELLGDEAALARQHEATEAAARAARLELVRAQAELDLARARGERLEAERRRLGELQAKAAALQGALGPLRREVLVHTESSHLLGELADAMRGRFGPAIGRYVEQVLPRLTRGRYRRVKIDPDLDLRVFSPERGDFVRLVELSTGTADLVLLALRLGLARALINARGLGGGHFLFLDEPLVSADEAREQAFVELLRAYDEVFAQIFVTSTRRLDGGPFQRTIELPQGAGAPEGEPAGHAAPEVADLPAAGRA